jgi:replicative DNA helicase Mcm
LVGAPGLAKTKLLREAVKLVPNSRFESGQSSSGKSLTAIVVREEESYFLRLGPVSLAKYAICAINEFGRMPYDEQAHFLDVMQERMFTINKYGINATIHAPTTIIASANPRSTTTTEWKGIYGDAEGGKLDLNDIPALKPVLDRFSLIFAFKNNRDEQTIREFATKKMELLNKEYKNNKISEEEEEAKEEDNYSKLKNGLHTQIPLILK